MCYVFIMWTRYKTENVLERFAEPFLYLNVHQTVKNNLHFFWVWVLWACHVISNGKVRSFTQVWCTCYWKKHDDLSLFITYYSDKAK